MTDIAQTGADTAAHPLGGIGPALLGPVALAWQGRWAAFWLFVALDIWALLLLMQGSHWAAAAVFGCGRLILIAAFLLRADHGAAPERPTGIVPLWLIGALAHVVSLVVIALKNDDGRFAALISDFPAWREGYNAVAKFIDNLIRAMTVQFDPVFTAIKMVLLKLLSTLEMALSQIPWPVFFILVGFMAWQRGGWRVLVLVWAALAYLGIFGFWDKAITTSALVLSALVVCILLGVPVGVAAAKNQVFKAIVVPVLDFMQTLPSFVYLLPAVAFFSIGKPPALIATVVFAVPPLIRLTCLGIEQVPGYVREAMYAHGATPFQTLIKAELPLALPSIQAGINQCIMMSLSMVVIAALIGGGGLGFDVLFALQNIQHGKGLLAGIAIVSVAIMFDRLVRSKARQGRK